MGVALPPPHLWWVWLAIATGKITPVRSFPTKVRIFNPSTRNYIFEDRLYICHYNAISLPRCSSTKFSAQNKMYMHSKHACTHTHACPMSRLRYETLLAHLLLVATPLLLPLPSKLPRLPRECRPGPPQLSLQLHQLSTQLPKRLPRLLLHLGQ